MKPMENKLTAVEWLSKELEGYGSPSALNIAWENFDILIAQAKAMEKEQIIDASNGYTQTEYLGVTKGEQYYNETYGE
jgi:hypothetical protein